MQKLTTWKNKWNFSIWSNSSLQWASVQFSFSVVGQTTDVLNLYSPLISSGAHYLQLLSSNSKKRKKTGGRDLINFKNTHSDKQSPENKSARPILPPSAIPGCVPAADNGCAPLRALYWDDR